MIEANLVKKAYIRTLPVQVLAYVVAAVNSIIDGLITARFIGTQAMAAVGFFVPVCTIIGISQVVSIGVQILCSKYVGSGKKKNAVNLFSSGVVFVSLYAFVVSLSCIFFRAPLSFLLGARGETATILQAYIVGYSFGVIGQVLSGMLMVFLPMNNDMRRSYVAIGVMVTTNVGLDVLFVNVLGLSLFGMGLATSVSFLASALVMILGFVNKRRPLSINLKKITFKEIPHASYLGLPSLMFTLGCTAKAYILNRTLMLSVGDAAVAAMNVQNSVCALLGSIPAGCANSFIALGSLYFGEHDRRNHYLRCGHSTGNDLFNSDSKCLLQRLRPGLDGDKKNADPVPQLPDSEHSFQHSDEGLPVPAEADPGQCVVSIGEPDHRSAFSRIHTTYRNGCRLAFIPRR